MSQNTIIKKCFKCGVEKSVESFYPRTNGLGIQSWCISCTKERGKRHRKATTLSPSRYITRMANMSGEDFIFFGKKTQGRNRMASNSFALISPCMRKGKQGFTVYFYENFMKKFRFIFGDKILIAFDKKNNLLAIKRTLDDVGYTLSQNNGTRNASVKTANENFIIKCKKYVPYENIIEQDGIIILDLN